MIDDLVSRLTTEEGFKGLPGNPDLCLPYRDTTGNLTTGFGWNLETKPLSRDRAKIILSWFAQDALDDLNKAFPWVSTCPANVKLALADMSYNLGIDTLSKFTTFLSMIRSGNYGGAADDLKTTLWAKQVGTRATSLENLIRS